MRQNQPLPKGNHSGLVNEAMAGSFLASHYSLDVHDISPVGQGQWSTAFAFRHAGREFVVRFGKHREDFDKDNLASSYRSTHLPIPAVTEIGEAFGAFYAISERAHGRPLDDLSGSQMREVMPCLFDALDATRVANVSSTTGYGAWTVNGIAPFTSWRAALLDVGTDHPHDRTYGWRAALAKSHVGSDQFDESYNHLCNLVNYCPDERHLVHSDLLNGNVLVENGRISAVLDWGCSMYGDFLYDVAWFAYWAPWYPAWSDIDFVSQAAIHYAANGLDVPNFAERIRCYQIHIGLAGLAYRAFKGDWVEVERRGRRTLEIAKQSV